MEIVGEITEETEYESEPEDTVSAWMMRRREASDDDDEENGEGKEKERSARINRRIRIRPGDDSDGLGGAPEFDGVISRIEELEVLGEELQELEGKIAEKEVELICRRHWSNDSDGLGGAPESVKVISRFEEFKVLKKDVQKIGREMEKNEGLEEKEEEEEKEVIRRKDEEGIGPFAVPTIGSFYMHDNRFQGPRRGGNRDTVAGRKSKEFDVGRKWKHDKYEGMAQEEELNEARKNSVVYYEGCCNKQPSSDNSIKIHQSRPYYNSTYQNFSSKTVKGRGPIKYKPLARRSGVTLATENKQSGKRHVTTYTGPEKMFSPTSMKSGKTPSRNTSFNRVFSHNSDKDIDPLASKNRRSSANMNSDWHMFNLSTSSNNSFGTHKIDMQHGDHNFSFTPAIFPVIQFGNADPAPDISSSVHIVSVQVGSRRSEMTCNKEGTTKHSKSS